MAEREIRIRSWVRANADGERSGLLGYLSVFYGALILAGLVLRRTAAGRFALSFPARTDRSGRRHAYIRPIDDDARKQIEREIQQGLVANPGGVVP
jgi:hypothetical protein